MTLPSITCPQCQHTSYNPNDIKEGYCGACHDWTGSPDHHTLTNVEIVAMTTWVLEQVSIDEKTAQDATEGPWRWAHLPDPAKYGLVGRHQRLIVPAAMSDIYPSKFDAAHIARWGPTQVLADCETKRQTIDRFLTEHRVLTQGGTPGGNHWAGGRRSALLEVVQGYAKAYATMGRPGYHESWRL